MGQPVGPQKGVNASSFLLYLEYKKKLKMSIKEAWPMEADMDNRDPNSLNDHLKVTYEECIGEPDHTHTIDCVWKYSYKCFNMCKALCYIILTVLCGIPHAICWGCTFACLAFHHIWQVGPCVRCYAIEMACMKKCYTVYFDAMLTPVCESCSTVFNAFKK